MFSTYVLVYVCSLLAASTTVRTFESWRNAALVTKVTFQTFHNSVTVPTLWARVVLFLAPSASKRSVDIIHHVKLARFLIRTSSVISVQ